MLKTSYRIEAALIITAITSFAWPCSLKASDTLTSEKQSSSDILVIGTKKKTEIFKDVITRQFKVRGGGRFSGQYATFSAAICPSVGGFSDKHNKAVEDRIREVAAIVGIPVAAAGCSENLSVLAVENGPNAIQELRKKRRGMFAALSHYERDKLMNGDGPVYSWKAIGKLSTGSGADAKGGRISIPAGVGSLGPISVGGQRSHVKSKLVQSTFEGISHAYVLIENAQLRGITPNQLADYAAMVSLIDIKPDSNVTSLPDSILTLFDGEDDGIRPVSIAQEDLFLLTALYKAPRSLKATGQRSAMLHFINQELERKNQDSE